MSARLLLGEPTPSILPPDGDKGRDERGAYYTPDLLAQAICKTLFEDCGIGIVNDILEPGCGGGSFLRAASFFWPESSLHGVDLLPACSGPGLVEQRDLFGLEGNYSLIVGNPDYAIAEKVVRHCMGLLRHGGTLAFLLRASFTGSSGRVALYREFPLRCWQPIAQRPSFTANGKTDPMEYALFVWQRGHSGNGTIFPPLVWR